MCDHQPPCPPIEARDREAARTVHRHPEQGWSRLCNGLVLFDDGGELLPSGRAVPPVPLPRRASAAETGPGTVGSAGAMAAATA
jgi:hypothetical protein